MGHVCATPTSDPSSTPEQQSHNNLHKRTIETDFISKTKDPLQNKLILADVTPRKHREKSSLTLTPKLKEELRKSKIGSKIKAAFIRTKCLQDFEVIRGLGKGAFGKVYLIRQKDQNQQTPRASKKLINLESLQLANEEEEQSLPLEIANMKTQKDVLTERVQDNSKVASNMIITEDNGKDNKMQIKKQQEIRKQSRRYFALKIINKSLIKSDKSIEQAKLERMILESVDHPFIIKLHYAFQTKSRLFLIVDLLEGGQLFFLLRKIGKFKEEVARFYAAEILLALEYLHQQCIIYRDLKPENILLDAEGHIKVTDFGLSKFLYSSDSKTYSFCGTAQYIAPEVITGKGYGQEADWFSYGSLLYDMLTGRPPFASKDKRSILKKLLTKPIPIPYYLSSEAKSLLSGLFKVNPSERLGFKEGAAQIKRHKFFEGIDFQVLYERRMKPPMSFRSEKKEGEGLMINANGFQNWDSWKANIENDQKVNHKDIEGFTYGDISFEVNEPDDLELTPQGIVIQ